MFACKYCKWFEAKVLFPVCSDSCETGMTSSVQKSATIEGVKPGTSAREPGPKSGPTFRSSKSHLCATTEMKIGPCVV